MRGGSLNSSSHRNGGGVGPISGMNSYSSTQLGTSLVGLGGASYRSTYDQSANGEKDRMGGLTSLGALVSRFENGPIPSLAYLDFELIPEVEEIEQQLAAANAAASHGGAEEAEDNVPSRKRSKRNPTTEQQSASSTAATVAVAAPAAQAPKRRGNAAAAAVTNENASSEADSGSEGSGSESENESQAARPRGGRGGAATASTAAGTATTTSGGGRKGGAMAAPVSASAIATKIRRFLKSIYSELSARVYEKVSSIFEVLLIFSVIL